MLPFCSSLGLYPGCWEEGRGGLLTVLEGLTDYEIPCADVLSVAGFFTFPFLLLLGFGVYSEVKSMPDYRGFLVFLPVLDSYSYVLRFSHL